MLKHTNLLFLEQVIQEGYLQEITNPMYGTPDEVAKSQGYLDALIE